MVRHFAVSIIILTISAGILYPCTTAIVSASATKDGRPLLWKHRDSSDELTSIVYFTNGKYDYIGLVNASDKEQDEVWIGYNETGFAIMNSASYNLKPEEDSTQIKDREGILMRMALQRCASLNDFEYMLDTLRKPLGVEANFGVIDARGGAAYYETDNFSYQKMDVNDPGIAPKGYVIRTNYSFTGDSTEGYGYIRFNTAQALFDEAKDALSWKYIVQNVSRSLKHSLTGVDLVNSMPENDSISKYIHFQDYIPRYTSSSSIVVQGVTDPTQSDITTMWTVMGFPLCSVVLPCWMNPQKVLPAVLLPDEKGASELSRIALAMKRDSFPIQRGSGKKYINLSRLINRQKTGHLQRIQNVEKRTISIAEQAFKEMSDRSFDKRNFNSYYREMDQLVRDEMGRYAK